MNETSKAVFLSYASQDAKAAHRICEALLMPIISANTRPLRILGAARPAAGSYASPAGVTLRLHQRMKRSQLRVFDTPFWPDTRWAFPASQDFAAELTQDFPDPNRYARDERGLLFTYIFFAPRRLGRGQFWLMSHQDSTGAALEGGKSYRLRVPPNVPIRQYWSMTAYDRQTHAFMVPSRHCSIKAGSCWTSSAWPRHRRPPLFTRQSHAGAPLSVSN